MTHELVATYPTAEAAREAVTVLERQGVEAADIELRGAAADEAAVPMHGDAMRHADQSATGRIGRRAAGGAVAGAVVGFLAGALILFLVTEEAGAALGGGLALGALCTGLGFFWAGGSALPVSETWGDTFNAGEGEAVVVVHLHDDVPALRDRLTRALRGTNPHRLEVA